MSTWNTRVNQTSQIRQRYVTIHAINNSFNFRSTQMKNPRHSKFRWKCLNTWYLFDLQIHCEFVVCQTSATPHWNMNFALNIVYRSDLLEYWKLTCRSSVRRGPEFDQWSPSCRLTWNYYYRLSVKRYSCWSKQNLVKK